MADVEGIGDGCAVASIGDISPFHQQSQLVRSLITIVTAEVASFKLVAEDKVAIEVGRSVKKEKSY